MQYTFIYFIYLINLQIGVNNKVLFIYFSFQTKKIHMNMLFEVIS
jgi:hypothetical protein